VITEDGTTLTVTRVTVSQQDLTAYNLSVAGIHTYHVTWDNILVHNCGGGTGTALVKHEPWPENDGFLAGYSKETTLKPGTRIDRYGSREGAFTSPEGTPFGQRGLPSSRSGDAYSVFTVQKPVMVRGGLAASWDDSTGGGIQYKLPSSISQLIGEGFIR